MGHAQPHESTATLLAVIGACASIIKEKGGPQYTKIIIDWHDLVMQNRLETIHWISCPDDNLASD